MTSKLGRAPRFVEIPRVPGLPSRVPRGEPRCIPLLDVT
jgi:hypothetical protein